MKSTEMDIEIEQGSTFHIIGTWYGEDGALVDLTSYTARMQIRNSVDASAKLLDSALGTIDITLGGALGTITIAITAVNTAALDFVLAVYDLELILSDVVKRLVHGNVRLKKEVTR